MSAGIHEGHLEFAIAECAASPASRRPAPANAVCGGCGQLSHCLPDNIDAHRPMLLAKFKEAVHLEPSAVAPGGIAAGAPVTGAAAEKSAHCRTPGRRHRQGPRRHRPRVAARSRADFLLLEAPIDRRHAHAIARFGGRVIVERDPARIRALAPQSDIVQLEYWGHPLLDQYAPFASVPGVKTVCWCHVSGLFAPALLAFPVADRLVLTSDISLPVVPREFVTGLPSSTVASALPAWAARAAGRAKACDRLPRHGRLQEAASRHLRRHRHPR